MNSKGYRDGGSIAGRGPMGERYKNKHRIFKEQRGLLLVKFRDEDMI